MCVNMITCDKIYVELDDLVERSDIDYTELNHLIESLNIPTEPISCAMRIKKKDPNYKRINELFNNIFNKANKNEN